MTVFAPTELLWALVGLILTIGGTLIEASITNPPWAWGHNGLQPLSLGVSYQVGAVLLVGCLGGKNAGAISQIAYLLLGLVGFNVFTEGHGIEYILRPNFGYLLGFIPGAWVCGWLAFRVPTRLESIAFSCLVGLLTIHLVGISYLLLMHMLSWGAVMPLGQMILTYSIYRLPGQLIVLCAVTVLAYISRHLMFY